jgi:TolA protein
LNGEKLKEALHAAQGSVSSIDDVKEIHSRSQLDSVFEPLLVKQITKVLAVQEPRGSSKLVTGAMAAVLVLLILSGLAVIMPGTDSELAPAVDELLLWTKIREQVIKTKGRELTTDEEELMQAAFANKIRKPLFFEESTEPCEPPVVTAADMAERVADAEEEEARQEKEEKTKQEVEEEAKQEAEVERAKQWMAKQQQEEEEAKQEAAAEEEARKAEEAETAKQEAEEKVKQEAEEKAKQEAEEKAKQEEEEKAKQEAEEKAKQEADAEKAKQEADAEKAKQEAQEVEEGRVKKEAETKEVGQAGELSPPLFRVGQKVEGNWLSEGDWYSGTIIGIRIGVPLGRSDPEPLHTILYDDGETEKQVTDMRMRTLTTHAPLTHTHHSRTPHAHVFTTGHQRSGAGEQCALHAHRVCRRNCIPGIAGIDSES